MQNFGLCLFLIVMFLGLSADCRQKKSEIPVYSTQGLVETNVEQVEHSNPTKEEKFEQKARQNRSIRYIKVNDKITKQNSRKLHKERELQYLEYRLELKKQKLEMLNSKELKGEDE